MKTKITTLFLTLAAFTTISWAQPIITGVTGAPFGTKTHGYPIPGTITEATAGAGQTWDYSSIPYDPSTFYFKSVDYATLSPTMQANFPTGNAASELYFGASLAMTQVFQYEATDVLYLGFNTTVFPVADTQLVFPHSYLETHAGFTYDAYGTVITPFGTYSNIVRLREVSGANFKYDFWQFSPDYKLLMEYLVDSTTQVMSGKYFFDTELPTYVNELAVNNGFEIFPNPVIDNITIKPSFTGNTIVEIYTVEGKKLLNQTISVQTNIPYTLDISNLESGIYFAKLSNNNNIYTRKIIIQ